MYIVYLSLIGCWPTSWLLSSVRRQNAASHSRLYRARRLGFLSLWRSLCNFVAVTSPGTWYTVSPLSPLCFLLHPMRKRQKRRAMFLVSSHSPLYFLLHPICGASGVIRRLWPPLDYRATNTRPRQRESHAREWNTAADCSHERAHRHQRCPGLIFGFLKVISG